MPRVKQVQAARKDQRNPCKDCPWRIDAPAGHWHKDEFVNIARTCRGDGLRRMGCHNSSPDNPIICMGWVRVEGFDSIGVRLACISGELNPADVNTTTGPDLFNSIQDMIDAQRPFWKPGNKAIKENTF